MNMKTKIIAILFLTIGINAMSQQLPQYSQYLRNQFMINPGAAGIYEFTDFTICGRNQWMGFADAPKTTYASISAPLGKARVRYNPGIRISSGPIKNPEIKTGKFKHALGFQMIADQYGAFQSTRAAGTYALHLPVTKTYNLSFGARLGLNNNNFLKDKALVKHTDTDIPYQEYIGSQLNKYVMNIGAGLYFYSNKLFVGVSADNLTRDMISFGGGVINFDDKMHFNVTAGTKLALTSNVTLTPAFLVKYMSPSSPMIEASMQIEYLEWLWFGVSYRNTDSFIGMCGLNISKRFKFGYSYDYTTSRLNNYSKGSHELVLGIMLR